MKNYNKYYFLLDKTCYLIRQVAYQCKHNKLPIGDQTITEVAEELAKMRGVEERTDLIEYALNQAIISCLMEYKWGTKPKPKNKSWKKFLCE